MRYGLAVAVLAALVLAGPSVADFQNEDPNMQRAILDKPDDRTFYDFAPNKPTSPQQVADAIPRVYVRFDDNRMGVDPDNPVKQQVAAYLRRGLPVALALNGGLIDDACGAVGGKMCWEDIRDLQRFAERNGTVLHLMQHTNYNMASADLSTYVFDLTHDEIVQEFRVDEIMRETGYRVRMAVLPGDPGRQEFYRRNREYVQSVCDSLGIWFINSLSGADSVSTANFNPAAIPMDLFSGQSNNFRLGGPTISQARPSLGLRRSEIPSGITDISGAVVVERVASDLDDYAASLYGSQPDVFYKYGREDQTGVIPPSHDEWTLTGNGNDASTVGYTKTLWHFITTRLANNYGFAIVGHDSTTGSASSTLGYANGGWSHEHVAWVLAMLQKKGHIKVVGPEEWALWATGEYAPGVDLISNPSMAIPQYDVGDTLGATSEYPWPRGFSAIGTQAGAQPTTTSWYRDIPVEQTGNVAKYERGVAGSPYSAVGDSVTGVRGRRGGFFADGSTVTQLNIGQGNLKPGRYRFSFAVKPDTTRFTLNEMHIGQKLRGYLLNTSIEANFAPSYQDTLIRYMWKDSDVYSTVPDVAKREWSDVVIPFEFPAGYMGSGTGSDDGVNVYGQSDEATGQTLFQPYANAGAEFLPLVGSARWGFTLFFSTAPFGGSFTISNPRLIYLGD